MTIDANDSRHERRGPGRPRDARIDQAVVLATLQLLCERGLEDFSIEGVAERANVPRSSIYRRWKTKPELFASVLNAVSEAPEVKYSGDIRADLTGLVQQQIERYTSSDMGRAVVRVILALALAGWDDDADSKTIAQRALDRQRERTRQLFRDAALAGEIRLVDPDLAVDLVFGAFWGRLLALQGAPADLAADIVDVALNGLRVPS